MGVQIFQKSRLRVKISMCHLKIPGTIMVIWSKFPNEGLHILGVAVYNLVWRHDLCTHDAQYYVGIGNQHRFICQRNWLAPWSTLQSKFVRGGEVTLLSIWSGYKLQGKRSLQPKVLCYPAQEWTRSDMEAKTALTWRTKSPSSNAVKIEWYL